MRMSVRSDAIELLVESILKCLNAESARELYTWSLATRSSSHEALINAADLIAVLKSKA